MSTTMKCKCVSERVCCFNDMSLIHYVLRHILPTKHVQFKCLENYSCKTLKTFTCATVNYAVMEHLHRNAESEYVTKMAIYVYMHAIIILGV